MIVVLTSRDIRNYGNILVDNVSVKDVTLPFFDFRTKREIIEKSPLVIYQDGNNFKILKIRQYIRWAKTDSVHHTQDLGQLLYTISLLEK